MNRNNLSSAEEVNKSLNTLNKQIGNWLDSGRALSLLEKDIIKEQIRHLYVSIDHLALDKMEEAQEFSGSNSAPSIYPSEVTRSQSKISDEVLNVFHKAEKPERESEPVIAKDSISKMIENATVINSVERTEATQAKPEEIEAPLQTEVPHQAIEEKTMEARIQEVKASIRYESTKTIGSTYAAGETISDKINKSHTEKSLSEKIKTQSLADLKQSIGLNERFAFINELFNGDQQLYHQSIDQINSMQVYDEAKNMLQVELKQKLNWDLNHPRMLEFDELIKRRFNA